MDLKVSLILLMASSAMSSAPQSLYFTYPAAAAPVLNKQPYPLYQTFIRQPSYQLPLYQQNYQYLPQPTIAKRPVFQLQPSAFQSQALPAFQADTRKIVLQESRPPPSQEVTHRPNYSFAYSVNDEKSGDQKSHQETRNGDNVIGKYTVVEPDGTLRIVTYTAGKEGFNAIVERQPPQLVQQKPVTVIKQFPVRKIVAAQSQPILFKPIVQAQAIASAAPTLAFGNYYYN